MNSRFGQAVYLNNWTIEQAMAEAGLLNEENGAVKLKWVRDQWMKPRYRVEDTDGVVWTITKEDDNRWYVNRYQGPSHLIYGYPHKTLKAAKEDVEYLRG